MPRLATGARVEFQGSVSPLSGRIVEAAGAGVVEHFRPLERWPDRADVVVVFDDGRRRCVPADQVTLQGS